MTVLYLIRHARSTWNAQGRWQGQADPPLDEFGQQQAAALAAHLRAETFAAVYSSPLARARQTAEHLARAQGLDLRLDDRLKERHVGEWSGLTEAQVRERYPEHYRPGWWIAGPPGGEAQAALAERSQAAFQAILAAHPDETVAVVSHGGTLNAFLAVQLGIPPGRTVTFRFANASFARLSVKGDRVYMVSLGETAPVDGIA